MNIFKSFLIAVFLLCGVCNASDWTQIPSGAKVCVSHSGNDSTGNGTESAPYATLNKAISVVQPGTDIWIDSGTWGGITNWNKSGTNTNPCVIMTWPGRSRAILQSSGPAFQISIGAQVNNLWLIDLDLRTSSDYPVDFLGSGQNILIEGCRVSGGIGTRIQGYPNPDTNRWTNVKIFRSVFSEFDTNGIYTASVDGIMLTESAIAFSTSAPNLRHQGVYIHQSCTSAIVTECMFAYPCAGALQQRIGGLCDNSLFVHCPIGAQIGHNETAIVGDGNVRAFRATGSVTNCVAIDGYDIGADNPRGFAFLAQNATSILFDKNIALHNINGSQPISFRLEDSTASIKNSVVIDWPDNSDGIIESLVGSTITQSINNDFRYAIHGTTPPNGTYPNHNRNLSTYASSIGLSSETAFWNAVKANSKVSWDNRLVAGKINDYFRAGVGVGVQHCVADLSNDGAVSIDDILMFINGFQAGSRSVDLDNGSGNGISDSSVDINDLLFFLQHFEQGC